jgi:hypothetical protein
MAREERHHLNANLYLAAIVPSLRPAPFARQGLRIAVCYTSGMDPLHATIEEFAAEGYGYRDSGGTDWRR